jgi:hypothetical protein
MPLFSGYVLLCSVDAARREAIHAKRRCQTIKVTCQELLAREPSSLEHTGGTDPTLGGGRPSCVAPGPLPGVEACAVRHGKAERRSFRVMMLDHAASLEDNCRPLELVDLQ